MKKIVVVLVSLVIAVLIGVGYVFIQDKTSKASTVFIQDKTSKASIPNPSLGPEWKLVFTGSDGSTYYVNTKRITYLPEGFVKVQILVVPRGELRRTLVNALKHDLTAEGKDPNNAERFWYTIGLHKVNCETHQSAQLEATAYSFGPAVLIHESPQYEEWHSFPPGSPDEAIEKYVCK